MNDSGFVVDIGKIARDVDELSVSRRLAERVQSKMYLSVKEVLGDISSDDIHMILECSRAVTKSGEMDWERTKRAYVFALVMITAEGAVTLTPDNADVYVGRSWAYLAMESLSRKGFVDFTRENASFTVDDHTEICVLKPEFKGTITAAFESMISSPKSAP